MSVEKPTLPVLRVEVSGLVNFSNVGAFRTDALKAIAEIPETLMTDEDFAQAETDTKWCGDIRAQLKIARTAIIEQTGDISALLALIDEIDEAAKAKESKLSATIKNRKDAIKDQIVQGASLKLQQHIKILNQDLPKGCHIFCPPPCIFKDAMKGKRTVNGCREAVEAVYNEEVEKASGVYLTTLANWAVLGGREHLMRDFSSHCRKDPDDFLEVLSMREKEEELRLENERLKQQAEVDETKQRIADRIEARKEQERGAAQALIEEIAAETVTANVRIPEPEVKPEAPLARPVQPSSPAMESASFISAFMKTEDFGEDRWKVRSILTKYEKFRAQQVMQEAA